MPLHDDQKIFPLVLCNADRLLLDRLSTDSGLSKAGVLRLLIYKEFATRQLAAALCGGLATGRGRIVGRRGP
jgi:hypothetical protein